MAVTHSDDTSQRLVDLPIRKRDLCHLHVAVPDNPNLTPPGWYLLFLCDHDGIPSVAEWVHLDRKPAVKPITPITHVEDKHITHAHDHNPGFPIPGFPRRIGHKKEAD